VTNKHLNNEEGYHQVVSQTEKKFVYKNSIYFALPVHRQEYRNYRNIDDALVVRNILSFYIQILSQFLKPPGETLLRYFNMFHPRAIAIISTIH
jgi:hypothetical protein